MTMREEFHKSPVGHPFEFASEYKFPEDTEAYEDDIDFMNELKDTRKYTVQFKQFMISVDDPDEGYAAKVGFLVKVQDKGMTDED